MKSGLLPDPLRAGARKRELPVCLGYQACLDELSDRAPHAVEGQAEGIADFFRRVGVRRTWMMACAIGSSVPSGFTQGIAGSLSYPSFGSSFLQKNQSAHS